jgi:hypothetical protein
MSKTFVDPQALPPTSSAAKYHSMRVYLQVQQWMGNNELNLRIGDGHCTTENILLCKEGQGSYTNRATGDGTVKLKNGLFDMLLYMQEERHGMLLTSACGQCRGVCSNITNVMDGGDDVDMD